MEFVPGSYITSRYRVVRFLGEGAYSGVYEAIDESTPDKLRVAVKVLHRELSENAKAVRRFEREVQATGTIGSQHITRVHGSGKAPEGYFIVFEYLEGETLQARLRERKSLPPEEAALIVFQVLSGLVMAHALGVVHRDLKPANLMLVRGPTGGDFVKVLDFGASKLASAGSSITSMGTMIGTPMYMSPEQIRNSSNVDVRSDVYGCGVVLYHCVTGHVPFDARNPAELAFRVVSQDPPSPETHVPGLDPELSAIIMRAMARDAKARFQSTLEMRNVLRGWLAKRGIPVPWTETPTHARRAPSPSKWGPAAMILAVLILGAIAVFMILQR
jgi:eukaryotic-like serine/threonine-protein kinase